MVDDLRNRVRVVYGAPYWDTEERRPVGMWERLLAYFGRRFTRPVLVRPFVEAQNAALIAEYGERLMVVEESEDGPIRTEADARILAEAILADLTNPPWFDRAARPTDTGDSPDVG